MTQPAPTAQQITLKDMIERAMKESGADMDSLPVADYLVWQKAPNGEILTVTVGKELPMAPGFIVIAIFPDDSEYRAYAVSGKADQVPRVVHFARAGVTFLVEKLQTLDAFVTTLAAEFGMIGYGMKPIEKERAAIADFVRGKVDSGEALSDVADQIESGDYEDEEEDDEPETQTQTEPAPPPAAPTAEA